MIIYIITIIIILIILYILICYNKFVKLNNQVKEAFSTMDVYLKKRWDLIPNIVEIVKEYAKYEKETIKEITELRNDSYDKMTNSTKVDVNSQISNDLNKIMALVENYPELKANDNFKDLSQQLTKIEDEIANSRKYYNGAVKIYNNKIMMIPSNFVAKLLGYKPQKMFEISRAEKENIKVEL